MRHVCDLPAHQYVEVDRKFLSRGERDGWEEAVWFAVSAVPHRAWGLTVLLKCGAIYRGLPPHAIVLDPVGKVIDWKLEEAQRWDCFGYDFTCHRHAYLRELDCSAYIFPDRRWLPGSYLFTADFYDDAYSLEPSQTKSSHFIALDNGRLAVLPGNNLLWEEASFTRAQDKPSWLRVQNQSWHAERPGWDHVVGEETA